MDPLSAFDALPDGAAHWQISLWWIAGAALVSGATCAAGVWLAGAPLRRVQRSAVHWSEWARAGQPVIVTAGACTLAPPIALGALASRAAPPHAPLAGAALGLAVGAVAYLAAFAVRHRATSRVRDGLGFAAELRGEWIGFAAELRGEWIGFALGVPHLFVVGAMLAAVGPALDAADLAVAGLGAGLFALASRSGGLQLLRALGAARPADAALRGAVDEAARRVGVPVRAVWVVGWPLANAFALPWSRELIFSEPAVAALAHEERVALTAHELGHLSEPVGMKLARSAAVWALFPLGLALPIVARWGATGLAVCMAGVFAVLLAVAQLARRMEQRADSVAHGPAGDAIPYARALEKLYRANATPAVMMQKRPLHPHLYDRLLAAGVEPDFPRPAPPSASRTHAAILAAFALCATLATVLLVAPLFWVY